MAREGCWCFFFIKTRPMIWYAEYAMVKDVGIAREVNKMRCEVCGSELYESEKEFNDGKCWYCEEDEKEPDIGSGSSIG